MEDNLTRLIPVVRNCVTVYRCVFRGRGRNCRIVLEDGMAPRNCCIVFHTEDLMAQHLYIEHETDIFNLYLNRRVISEEEKMVDFRTYLSQAERDRKDRRRKDRRKTEIAHLLRIRRAEEMGVQDLRIAHETEIPNLCRIGRAISEEKMEADFDTYLIKVARNCRNSYSCVFGGCRRAINHTEDGMTYHLRSEHSTEIRHFYDYIIGIYEEKVEDDFGTYLIRVARDCATSYRCVYDTGHVFYTKDEMVQHLTEVHETEMLSTYNLLNGILAAVRRALSEEEMEPNIRTFVTNFVRRIEAKYRTLAGLRRGRESATYGWWDDYNEEASIEKASIGRAITEKEMEVDFDTYVIQVVRRYAHNYRCVYCGEELHAESDMVYHLRKPELAGGHKTKMRNSQAKKQAREQARLFEEQAKEQARFLEEQALLRHVFF